MTPPVEIRPPAHRPTRHFVRGAHAGIAIAAVATSALVVWLMAAVLRDPGFIDRVQIDNPSGYDIHVDVADRDGQSRLPLGVVGQRCAAEFEDVIDFGDVWVVEFSTQGRKGGGMTVSRVQLERDGWNVRVPDEVVNRLTATGAPPAPRHSCGSA